MSFFKQWIRIPGIIAALLIAGLVYFLGQMVSGFMLKSAIEDYGSDALGAKVEVADASIGFFPPKVEFAGLAFTDPDTPMQNMAEIGEIKAELDLYQLVVGRVVINELNYTGLRFSTPRSSSGAINKKQDDEVVYEEKDEPDLIDKAVTELPNADEIMASESLLSDEVSKELQNHYQQCDSQWTSIKETLASGDEFKAWGDEIQQLTSGKIADLEDAKQRADRLKEIRKTLKQQAANYRKAKDHLSSCNKELKAKTKELKNAPQKDIDRLNEKYFSSGQGALSNITQLLFGDDVQGYIDTGLEWYQKVMPILQALKSPETEEEEKDVYGGEFIEFEEFDRQADFSIRKMQGDVTLDIGKLAVTGVDLNADQAFSKKPSTLDFSGEQLEGLDSIKGKLVFNRISQPDDNYQVNINQYQLENFVLSEDASLPLSISNAIVNVETKATYTSAGFRSQSVARFTNAAFEVGESASSTVKKVFDSMQAELSTFVITLELHSDDGGFSTSVNSDLDKIIGSGLKKALKDQVEQEKQKLKNKLKAEAEAKLKEQLAKVEAFSSLESSISEQGQGLDELIESSLKDPVKQLQEQKEAEIKAELDAKKEAEKDKLKDKLKSRFGF